MPNPNYNSIGINVTPVGNIYPAYSDTIADAASASSPTNVGAQSVNNPVAQAQDVGKTGNPLAWWFGLLVIVVGLMFAARHIGSEDEFKNIRPGVYNILIIGLAAILGLTFWKVVFSKVKVPGLSTIVLNA